MKNWNKKLNDNIKALEDAKSEAEVFKSVGKGNSRDLMIALAKVNLLDDAKTKLQIKIASLSVSWDGKKRSSISDLLPKRFVLKKKNELLCKLVAEAENLGADFSNRKFN